MRLPRALSWNVIAAHYRLLEWEHCRRHAQYWLSEWEHCRLHAHYRLSEWERCRPLMFNVHCIKEAVRLQSDLPLPSVITQTQAGDQGSKVNKDTDVLWLSLIHNQIPANRFTTFSNVNVRQTFLFLLFVTFNKDIFLFFKACCKYEKGLLQSIINLNIKQKEF